MEGCTYRRYGKVLFLQDAGSTETCILFLVNPEDVSAGTAYDDRDLHSTGNLGSSVSEQIPGLLCKRNYFYRGVRTKLLAWPDLTEHLRCTASLGKCSSFIRIM